MLSELIDILVENGKGIHAYQKCADRARELAISSPDCATAYFLLAAFAEDFIEYNERMATTTIQTAAYFERFVEDAGRLEKALQSGEPGKMLTSLNQVASELANTGN